MKSSIARIEKLRRVDRTNAAPDVKFCSTVSQRSRKQPTPRGLPLSTRATQANKKPCQGSCIWFVEVGQCVFYLFKDLCLSCPPSRARHVLSANAVTAGARAALWRVVEQDPGGGILLFKHKSCFLYLQPCGGKKTERGMCYTHTLLVIWWTCILLLIFDDWNLTFLIVFSIFYPCFFPLIPPKVKFAGKNTVLDKLCVTFMGWMGCPFDKMRNRLLLAENIGLFRLIYSRWSRHFFPTMCLANGWCCTLIWVCRQMQCFQRTRTLFSTFSFLGKVRDKAQWLMFLPVCNRFGPPQIFNGNGGWLDEAPAKLPIVCRRLAFASAGGKPRWECSCWRVVVGQGRSYKCQG